MYIINYVATLALYGLTLSLFVTADDALAKNDRSNSATVAAISNETHDTAAIQSKEAGLVEKNASDALLTKRGLERAQAAFGAQLALDCSSNTQMSWVAEDAVYQYSLSNINVKLSVEGYADVTTHLCALAAFAPVASAENIRYFPTLDPEIVYVQYDLVATDGSGNLSRQLAIVELQGTQIARFTQLSRSPESLKVLRASL